MARRMAAVAALLRQRVAAAERAQQRSPEYSVIDGFEQTTAEVAAAMNLSPMAAGYLVSDAEALDTRLPRVAALLAEGRTDWRTVRLIISRTDLVTDDELIAKVDRSLAERIGNWHGWSRQRIINAVDAAVRVADPDAARERRVAAENERYIGITAHDNGMAEIYGTVAAAAATAFDRRLSAAGQAGVSGRPADAGSAPSRRAAALTQAAAWPAPAGNRTAPPGPTPAATDAIRAGRRWSSTWWPANRPCTATARARLSGGLRGHRRRAGPRNWPPPHRCWLADPADESGGSVALPAVGGTGACGAVPGSDVPLPRMQPPGGNLRSRPYDSVQPSGSGSRRADGAENLKCLCRLHHRLKTFGGWRDRATGRWHRCVDLTHRADLSDIAGRRRPLPAAARAGLRGAGCQQAKPLEATQRSNCSGAQAQPRATTHQRSTALVGAGPEAGDRGAQVPKPHARHAVSVQGRTEHQPLLHLGERTPRTRRAACGLDARHTGRGSAARRPTLLDRVHACRSQRTARGSSADRLPWPSPA